MPWVRGVAAARGVEIAEAGGETVIGKGNGQVPRHGKGDHPALDIYRKQGIAAVAGGGFRSTGDNDLAPAAIK